MSSFDHSFPLPYRVTVQLTLAVWGWTLNVSGLNKAHIDCSQVIKFHHPAGLSSALYTLASAMTLVLLFSMSLFWLQASPPTPSEEVGHQDFLPWITFICMLFILFYPGRAPGRARLLSVFRRILLGGIDRENRLQDILVADVLTSYSRVITDVVIMFASLYNGRSCIVPPERSQAPVLVILIFSLAPFLIRLNQCFIEWRSTGKQTHILNLFKYATAFPMAFARLWSSSDGSLQLWVFTAFVNSAYSFIWDIRCDWDLNIQSLRPIRYFGSKKVYYLAVILDLLLRFTWSLKLFPAWSLVTDTECGMFYLALVEIFRRWFWVFLRIESDWAANHLKDFDLPVIEDKTS
ncbi:hypothetical protein TRICI_003748 [Trichomonascus ciferrii]|uniref:EXS domain-containing protein n=1 Tax=Trichomonascus ciferrii TaxID=44093 RepID=A0A642V2W0_9ASCO|nr:hypothetical protein TRICI_003748 [Trichomonascus ciferrii]